MNTTILPTQPLATYHKINANRDEFLQAIHAAGQTLGLDLNHHQSHQLLLYLDGLLLWTKAYNLTAITEPRQALVKHIFDCLAVLPIFDKTLAHHNKPAILDIGTGAGLPAVVLAILRPAWQMTALDSNGKKIRFIRQVSSELGLGNLAVAESRIEQFSGSFDVITSRAFASLADFIKFGAPFLKTDGVLLAMKGRLEEPEQFFDPAFEKVIYPIDVPELDDERCVVALTPKTIKEHA